MRLYDIISDLLYASNLIPIQANVSAGGCETAADTLAAIPAAGNADFLLKKDVQNIQTSKTSPSALSAMQEAQNAVCGKSVTGAKKVSGRLGKRKFMKLVNEQKAAALQNKPLLDDSLIRARHKEKIESALEKHIYDICLDPKTGLIHRINDEHKHRINKIFNLETDEMELLIIAPKEDVISKRIFIRLGHDMLAGGNGLCGAPGEQAVIDAYGPVLGRKLIEYGHTVMIYRSKKNKFADYSEANVTGVKEAEAFHADLFISCHANSYTDPSARGTLVIHNKLAISKTYAQLIQDAMLRALGTHNRGITLSTENIEMKETVKREMPAVILEPVFVTHKPRQIPGKRVKSDMDRFKEYQENPENEGGLGTAIAKCVHNFLQAQGGQDSQ